MNYIPFDYAIFAELKKQGEKKGFQIIPLFGQDFTLEECNQCDSIFCVFEGTYAFEEGGQEYYNKFRKILMKTTAQVFPSPKIQDFIIKKHEYMRYLEKKGYDIPPTNFIKPASYNIKTIMRFIKKYNLKDIVIKPELVGYKKGFKIIKNVTQKKVEDYLKKLKKDGYKNVLLQQFLEEFNKFGEVKTYWVGGKNMYSYKQQWKGSEGVFQPQEKINKSLLKKCLDTGKSIIDDLTKDFEDLIHVRIDFACCVDNDNVCREFFINEIEINPGISEEDSRGKGFVPLVKQILIASS
jgi:glutathione synthase/RimK-type ligase-like ATP-grasp enzyme